MMNSQSITIPVDHQDTRLDKFLSHTFPEESRSQIQKAIQHGHILVNDTQVKTGYAIQENDTVSFHFEEIRQEDAHQIIATDIPLDIVYEDEDLIVVNKSAEMVVHPGAGGETDTLVNALMHHCGEELSSVGGSDRLGIVHRLDKGTSGLLVCAKNNASHRFLAKQFEEKTAVRIYKAFCWHTFSEPTGHIETYIGRHPTKRKKQCVLNENEGRLALTNYKVHEAFPFLNLVHFKLETGRTHQIRVHSNYIKHPVFADDLYSGDERQIKSIHLHYQKFAKHLFKYIDRQALHAYKLSFVHPKTSEEMTFETKLPEDMQIILDKLRHKFQEEIKN